MEESQEKFCGVWRTVKDSVVEASQGEYCGLLKTAMVSFVDCRRQSRIVLWTMKDSQEECGDCGGQSRRVW